MSRISLIVPAYNAAPYLDASLASVAAQMRPADEVVVVDDCSTDDTATVAKRWASVLPLVLVHHSQNRGLGATRATGIARASGELVALLDADDYLFPDHFAVMLAHHGRFGGIVSANVQWWGPQRGVSAVNGRARKRPPASEQQSTEILKRNFLHPISVFSKRDYEQVGGFADLRCMEDWDLWLRMIAAGVRASMPEQVTALYRYHSESLSANRGNLETNVRVLTEHLERLPEQQRAVLRRTIRRRSARLKLLAGEREGMEGRQVLASRYWLHAVLEDRSLRGGLFGGDSSVALQALGNLLTGGRIARVRAQRRGDPGFGVRAK